MKTWPLLSLLFFPVAICNQEIDKTPTSVKLNEGHEKIFADGWNKGRRNYAREHRIPNMWKLEWSDELVQTAKSLPADCNSLKPGPNYRFTVMAHGWNDEWYENESNYFEHHDEEYGLRTSLYFLELVNPVQKTMGCAEYKCINRKSIIPKNQVPTMNFDIICLFGPESTIDIGEMKNGERGEAGSKCEEEGGEDDDGLCVPSESSGSSILFNFSTTASLVFLVSMIFD